MVSSTQLCPVQVTDDVIPTPQVKCLLSAEALDSENLEPPITNSGLSIQKNLSLFQLEMGSKVVLTQLMMSSDSVQLRVALNF